MEVVPQEPGVEGDLSHLSDRLEDVMRNIAGEAVLRPGPGVREDDGC